MWRSEPAAVASPRVRTRHLVIGLAATQTVSWGVLYYAFSVVLVPMQRDLGWSRSALVGGLTVAIVISGVAAPIVGRWLDGHIERALMTAGSVLGAVMVVCWSRATSPLAYYGAWIGIGMAMACVLYEPAFTVLAKRTAPQHRRAITAVTLVAGLASLIFQPVTSRLTERFGWRTSLAVLAAVLAVVTVPIHAVVLAGARRELSTSKPARPRGRPPETRERSFWMLTAAFAAVGVTSLGTSVLLIAYLVDHGWSLSRAAFAGGTLGLMQLPGRVAFGPLALRVHHATLAAGLLSVPCAGVLLLALSTGGPVVWPAVVVLGFGQGTTTLLRPTLFVDLYGTDRFGVLSGISATPAIVARALAPLGASMIVGATGHYEAAFVLLASSSLAAAALAHSVLRDT